MRFLLSQMVVIVDVVVGIIIYNNDEVMGWWLARGQLRTNSARITLTLPYVPRLSNRHDCQCRVWSLALVSMISLGVPGSGPVLSEFTGTVGQPVTAAGRFEAVPADLSVQA